MAGMTGFDLLPWLLALALGATVWWHALGARRIARRVARRRCREAGVHFIDELALSRVKLDRQRGFRIKRSYRFEFFQRGDRRYEGRIDMLGYRIERVELEPHPGPEDQL